MYKFYFISILLISCNQFNKEYKCSIEGNECEQVDKQSSKDTDRETPSVRNGSDGSSCSVIEVELGTLIECEDGTSSFISNPEQGPAGQDGVGCNVTPAINGALITCATGSVLVLNGQDGTDAPPTAYTVVGLVDPCGDKPGIYDEVFFRLHNGLLVASFSDNQNGLNTRFSVLTPGSYRTTDGSNCYFSVDSNLLLYNEHY